MILTLALILTAGLCAFGMGYALNQGSTCAVTAARQVIDERQAHLLTGFGVAAAAAGLVWLPLAWFGGEQVHLAPERPVGWGLILGAGLLGIGAVLNRACLLGSISRIGDGKVRFLGLPAGLAIGFAIADRLVPAPAATLPNPLAHPSEVGLGVLAAFGLLLAAGWIWMKRRGDSGDAVRWPGRVAMVVLGVAGAILFAIAPGWTVADAVRLGIAPLHPTGLMAMVGTSPMMQGALGLTMFALLCAGAVTAGVRRQSFRFRRPSVVAVSRSIGGGTVMALGASLVPGGNDTLLLAALPAATLSGLVAYLVMSAVVFALLLLRRTTPPRHLRSLPAWPGPARSRARREP